MRIGFCGAHRTGKSTLAKALAERRGLPFVASQVASIAASFRFNMDRDTRLSITGITMQNRILDVMQAAHQLPAFVSDRTPLDMAAYLLADAQMGVGTPALQEQALVYVDRCVRATEELFDVVILVPPAIAFEPVDGKPGTNPAYQELHATIVRGLHADLALPAGCIERDCLSIEDRLQAAEQFVYGVERLGTLLNLPKVA